MNDASRPVAIAFHETAVGGASRSILRVMPMLESRGWRFTCWTPGPGPLRRELEARGYEVAGAERLLRYSPRSLRTPPGTVRRLASVPGYLRGFRTWVRARAPQVLHANTLLTIPEAICVRRWQPTVLYAHETVGAGPKGTATALLARRAADVVVGISQVATAGLRRHGVRPLVVANGVPLPSERAEPRHGERLVVGMLGTVSRRKGNDVFLAAVRELRSRLPEAEFRMLGPPVEGPDREWAEGLIRAAREEGVHVGERAEPYAELRQWDIAVIPSRDEPFGLVAAEAMAVGLPVVASCVGGLPDVLGPDAGVTVSPDDPPGLAHAILTLARDPGLRATCGSAGRARVERHFTLDRQAAGIDRAYLTALQSAAAASP